MTMGSHSGVAVACLVACGLVVASCSGAHSGVTAVEAVPNAEEFSRDAPLDEVASLPAMEAVHWDDCDGQDVPWECGAIDVPLDYRRPSVSGTVSLAVTRLPATGERIGSLVLNPGGPGGSGLDTAWSYAPHFPDDLLSRFDIVGFDPRGVGRSTAVDCGDLNRSFRVVERDCIARSGDLLPYVGTVNAARDLELLRIALGDDQLTYLGFSYGTALGAVYADLFPESVRALVLAGSVDPDAGLYNVDGTAVGNWGMPFYGVQDFGGTAEMFFELCDATVECPAGPDSRRLLDRVYEQVGDASTDYFEGWDESVTSWQVDGILANAMYNTDLWAPLAVALDDAARGDASTLAAMGSFMEAGYPRVDNPTDNFIEANFAIYCADFAGRSGQFAVLDCEGWPETAEPLPPITPVELDTPIVVIGTDGDPATPGFLAPQMADALGDAVSVRWEGAGHTAFLHSGCVDQIVVDYLVDLAVPTDRTRCDFTDDVDTTVARAEQVFLLDEAAWKLRLKQVFVDEGLSDIGADCMADEFAGEGRADLVVYARFGVQRPEYLRLRERAEAVCGLT